MLKDSSTSFGMTFYLCLSAFICGLYSFSPLRNSACPAVGIFFISLPSKKRSKENAPENICVYPHQSWKSGAKQSTCFAFIPSSSLCFGAAIARGERHFDRSGEILFDTRTERPLDYARDDRRDGLRMLHDTFFFVFSVLFVVSLSFRP